MASTTIQPKAVDAPLSGRERAAGFKDAVSKLSAQLLAKKPEAGKFDTREDAYRAIMVHVISTLPLQNCYAERSVRAKDAAAKGIEVFTDIDAVCRGYQEKCDRAARILLADPELAEAAMAQYMTMRMSPDDASTTPLIEEKKTAYRKVRHELRDLSTQISFKFGLPMKQQGEGRPPSEPLNSTLRR